MSGIFIDSVFARWRLYAGRPINASTALPSWWQSSICCLLDGFMLLAARSAHAVHALIQLLRMEGRVDGAAGVPLLLRAMVGRGVCVKTLVPGAGVVFSRVLPQTGCGWQLGY